MVQGEKPARFQLGLSCYIIIIFGHCPFHGVKPNQPRLHENLLCREDWLQLRRIACSGVGNPSHPRGSRLILVHRVRATPLRRPPRGAPRRLSSHARWVPWYRCADKVDVPCSGPTYIICVTWIQNTGSRTSTWLEAIAQCVPAPLQPPVPFLPRFFLQEVNRTHSPFQPRWLLPAEVTSPSATGSLRSAARTGSVIVFHVAANY